MGFQGDLATVGDPLHVATGDHGDFVCHDDKPTLLVFHLLANLVTNSTANKPTASDPMTPLYMYRLSAGAFNRNIDMQWFANFIIANITARWKI